MVQNVKQMLQAVMYVQLQQSTTAHLNPESGLCGSPHNSLFDGPPSQLVALAQGLPVNITGHWSLLWD